MSTIRVVNLQHTDATEPNIVLLEDGTSVFASGITISGGTNLTVSGTAEFASGTVSAPGVTFIDDNNTGLYSPAADTVAITTTATERLRIDSSGNVGIGTTSPSQKLQVTSGNILLDGTDQYIYLSNDSDQWLSANAASNYLRIGTANQERMRIDSSGRLLLNSGTDVRIELGTTGTTGTNDRNHLRGDGASLKYNTASGGVHVFEQNGTERMRIDSSGRLLVGTSTGSHPLSVVSSQSSKIQFGQASDQGGFLFSDGAGSFGISGGGYYNGANWIAKHTASSHIRDDGDANIRFFTNSSLTAGSTFAPTERMRIDSSGRLGIGVSTMVGGGGDVSIIRNSALRWAESDGTQRADIYGDLNSNIVFRNGTGSTERMRIDGSGRLLVGTSSARTDFLNTTIFGSTVQIETATTGSRGLAITNNQSVNSEAILFLNKANGTSVGSSNVVSNGNRLGSIYFQGSDGSQLVAAASIDAQVDGIPGANDMPGRLVFSTTADGAASPTARMAIYNNGVSGVFATNADNFFLDNSAAAGTTYAFLLGRYGATSLGSGTVSFRVWNNGNVINTNNSYGALSDIKLKENIVNASSQWDDLKAIQVRNYNFKEGQTHTQIGVVAQEVELVSPGLVTESPDTDAEGNDLGTTTKSVNYSVLYMKAVKALQEAMERIETLEQRLSDAGIA